MYFEDGARPRWRCNGRLNPLTGLRCCNGRTVSHRADSFFSNRKVKVEDVLLVLYLWAVKSKRGQIETMTGLNRKTIAGIISDWYQMMQEDIRSTDCKIGGLDENGRGIIVEIDESKFGKRKYHRGHHVEGVWVVGGVELTAQRKCFLLTVPDRTERTLSSIIEEFVLPGSIVRTDCWRAYNNMVNLGMNLQHQTVNHSVSFRDGEVHTNTIEGN